MKMHKCAGLAVMMFGLAGCAAGPMLLPAIPAENSLTQSVNHPAYKAADTGSFSKAEVLYLANNSDMTYHRIPVGDFLLSELLVQTPRDKNITALRLEHFDVKCGDGAVFAPRALCTIDARFSFKQKGARKTVSIADTLDTGGQFAAIRTDLSFKPENNSSYIHEQAKMTVRLIASQFGKKI